MLLTALSPKALDASPAAITVSFVLLVILEAFIFIFVYFAAVTKIPRQFDRALKAGYPELVEIYGYEVIMSGNKKIPSAAVFHDDRRNLRTEGQQ